MLNNPVNKVNIVNKNIYFRNTPYLVLYNFYITEFVSICHKYGFFSQNRIKLIKSQLLEMG